MSTIETENQFIDSIRTKVEKFSTEFPVPAHGFDHSLRVAEKCREIAFDEGTENVFISELAGLLHDIGRVPEFFTPGNTKSHHELSYELLQKWFREDPEFNFLTLAQKKELLYAVRYHWSNAADDYESAWILRDADKIDLLESIGLQRTLDFHKEEKMQELDIRLKYDSYYWLHTETAKKIVKEGGLMEVIDEYYRKYLLSKIDKISNI